MRVGFSLHQRSGNRRHEGATQQMYALKEPTNPLAISVRLCTRLFSYYSGNSHNSVWPRQEL